jgi:hypothetical protein
MTRAIWVVEPKLSKTQREQIKRELGDAADRFIRGADDALSWYASARQTQISARPLSQVAEQLDLVAHHAAALSRALKSIDEMGRDSLEITQLRRRRQSPIPSTEQLLALAKDAKSSRPTPRRGARTDGARLALVSQMTQHYQAATGRRAGKTAGGPFTRVLEPVLKAAGIPSSNIRPLIRRALETT